MEFDYYQLYKDQSVPELVKVAKTPSDHLPEAVAAAARILKERGITTEEIAAEEWALAQKEMAAAIDRGRFHEYTDSIRDLFRSDDRQEPGERWFKVILVGYAIYYLYNLYVTIKELVFLTRCEYCTHTGSAISFDLVYSVYITLCLYYLLKQKQAGWALLMAQVIIMNCVKFSVVWHLYAHHAFFHSMFSVYVLPFLANTAVGIFLWKPFIREFFGITENIQTRTMLVAALVGLAVMMVV